MKLNTYFVNVPGLTDLFRNGKGYKRDSTYSKYKLCLTATNLEYLIEKLYKVSESDQCYRVKYRPVKKSGMYLGRIVMVNDKSTGEFWKILRSDKKLFCSVQDDEFCRKFRDQKKIDKIRLSIKNNLG